MFTTINVSEAFDLLDYLALLSDADLRREFNEANVAAILLAQNSLSREKRFNIYDVNEFVSAVRGLRVVKHRSAHDLSRCLIDAARWIERDRLEEAQIVYSKFMETNSSPFFLEIAKFQLKLLENGLT